MKIVAVLSGLALLLGIALWIPSRLVAKYYVKSHPESRAAQKVTRFDLLVAVPTALLLFCIFAIASLAPDSLLGRMASTWWGLIVLSILVIVISRLINFLAWKLSVRHWFARDRGSMNVDPVEGWNQGPIHDQALPAADAYGIELFNDDKTPMEFVVSVFCNCFGMPREAAVKTMLEIHKNGASTVGRLSLEHSQKLVQHIEAQAEKHGYPFRCRVIAAEVSR